MTVNCPICKKENQFSGDFESYIPVIQTCNFCKYNFFIYKKTSYEIYPDDIKWMENLFYNFGQEWIFKRQLKNLENALFLEDVDIKGKYRNVVGKNLLKKYKQLEDQYTFLAAERAAKFDKFGGRCG